MSTVCGKRALLNLPGYETTAAIVAETYEGEDGSSQVKLAISDCERTLNFKMYGPLSKHARNDIHKLSTLIECLETLLEAYK